MRRTPVDRSSGLPILFSVALLALSHSSAAAPPSDPPRTVTSRDGTRIAYDKVGEGPALVIIGGALSDRRGGAELAQSLANDFTVYGYDRRGRGNSGDTAPYSVTREIEDLEALIDEAGGSAYVYGKSSGASLALRASVALGGKVKKLAIYEAPYDEAEGAATEWKTFTKKLDALLAANERGEAVESFLAFVGMPPDALAKLKASPAWSGMVAMAPTLRYDNAVVGVDRSVPVAIVSKIAAPTLVMDGGASLGPAPSMHASADKLGKLIASAQRLTIEGQAHDVDPKVLAPVLAKFFR